MLPFNPLIPPSTHPAGAFDATWTGHAACAATAEGGLDCTYAGKNALAVASSGAAQPTRAGVKAFSAADLVQLRSLVA